MLPWARRSRPSTPSHQELETRVAARTYESLVARPEAVRLDLAPALAAAGGSLVLNLDACPTVRFSPKNLRSILYNLLSNAIK